MNLLENLQGLDNLTSVSGGLGIISNENMTSLVGLESLISVGGDLLILNNNALATLSALGVLESIGENLRIKGDGDFNNLNGLDNLTEINGALQIDDIANLTSLSGLGNFDHLLLDMLIIQDCPNLSFCNVPSICDYLADSNNEAIINDNFTGCNSQEEVETECLEPLPVELIDFTAKKDEKHVFLTWHTASENNNAGFEIQRSKDGRDWDVIGFAEGKGTTSSIAEYQFIDTNPLNGINYYRLKQLDFDGGFEYSIVISVILLRDDNIQVYPNPANNYVMIYSPVKSKLEISNQLGILVKQMNISSGLNKIELSDLGSGIYFLKTGVGNAERIIKL